MASQRGGCVFLPRRDESGTPPLHAGLEVLPEHDGQGPGGATREAGAASATTTGSWRGSRDLLLPRYARLRATHRKTVCRSCPATKFYRVVVETRPINVRTK